VRVRERKRGRVRGRELIVLGDDVGQVDTGKRKFSKVWERRKYEGTLTVGRQVKIRIFCFGKKKRENGGTQKPYLEAKYFRIKEGEGRGRPAEDVQGESV